VTGNMTFRNAHFLWGNEPDAPWFRPWGHQWVSWCKSCVKNKARLVNGRFV